MSDQCQDKFEIRIDGTPPRTVFICVPIALFADDLENGMALLHGKMREAEAHLAKLLINLRKQKIQIGVISPTGAPLMPT